MLSGRVSNLPDSIASFVEFFAMQNIGTAI